ncbi:MAG: TlyA family RNA methyltransferase [Candidatus Hodarchaeota archaeon]
MKERIDILLVEKKLAQSRSKAQWLIEKGYVFVEGKQLMKPSKKIDFSLEIQVLKDFPYVGRGGLKLEAILKDFSISVEGKICADIGASIGGFTDCLIKNGASKVYAIDIATDFLHSSLRSRKMIEKVIPILGVDARQVIPIEEKIDICTIDINFASLRTILPNVKKIVKKRGDIIALVKPIFETEFYDKSKFKIIQNPNRLFEILSDLIKWCTENQFFLRKIDKSPILGKEGSIEFFIYLKLEPFNLDRNYITIIKDILQL